MDEVARKLMAMARDARRVANEQRQIAGNLEAAAQQVCTHAEYEPVKWVGSRCKLCRKARDA